MARGPVYRTGIQVRCVLVLLSPLGAGIMVKGASDCILADHAAAIDVNPGQIVMPGVPAPLTWPGGLVTLRP